MHFLNYRPSIFTPNTLSLPFLPPFLPPCLPASLAPSSLPTYLSVVYCEGLNVTRPPAELSKYPLHRVRRPTLLARGP